MSDTETETDKEGAGREGGGQGTKRGKCDENRENESCTLANETNSPPRRIKDSHLLRVKVLPSVMDEVNKSH